jgi:4-hydroxybenzoate polyprenyltransferase
MEFIGSFKLYALLQIVTLSLLIAVGIIANLGSFFYLGLMAMSGFFIYQQYLTRHRERDKCFKAFLNNHYAGLTVFIALMLNYL